MADAPPVSPDRLSTRRLALRAIMDGRGLDAVILSSPRSLAHYGGIGGIGGDGGGRRLLVVTAREALPVGPAEGPGLWAEAAALLPPGCALGHEGQIPDDALREIARLARPRGMLSISAEVSRQMGDE